MKNSLFFRSFAFILAGLVTFLPVTSVLAGPVPTSSDNPHTPVASDGSQIDPHAPGSDDIVQTDNGAYSKGAKGNNVRQWERFVTDGRKSPSATADKPSTESIIGSDSRTRVKDPSVYPYRAIVHIESNIGNCTGWMIGSDTVATAGHCVYDPDSKKWASWAKVYPGRNGDEAPFGSANAKRFYSVTGWTVQGNHNHDYGAIKLDKSVGNQTGWFGYRWQSGSLNGVNENISGYPGDKDYGTQWEHRDQIRETTTYKLIYNNDTYAGQSGAPVYQDSYQNCGVCSLAIHANGVYGGKNSNRGTRITKEVFHNLNIWKNQ
ncbi:trypsin-like serine peptidase [Thermoactinomyces mirandus]|uniref:trypsin-like serine peptidase n=1 Tax=Thermoactinomyces mirandus TaxID=2756294 RepID=UPI0028A8AEC5|nr:serine protease [Thermoactinomyces mirandus]